ncbi:MAG: hypothetical protein AAF438_09050 [Pseudomonadota bacterium]
MMSTIKSEVDLLKRDRKREVRAARAPAPEQPDFLATLAQRMKQMQGEDDPPKAPKRGAEEVEEGSDDEDDIWRERRRRRRRKEYKDSSDESASETEKANDARKRAERATVQVPLSGLVLDLNVRDKDRLAATSLLKWITRYGTVTAFVEQSPHFQNPKNTRSKYEAAAWARSLDLMINEVGWKRCIKWKFVETNVRRLLALEVSCKEGGDWSVARRLEENHIGFDRAEQSAVTSAMKQLRLEQKLTTAHQPPQKDKGGEAGGKK